MGSVVGPGAGWGDPLILGTLAAGVMVLTMASFFGVIYLAALFLQDCLGVSPLVSGLSTFPEALGIMVGSTFAGRFVHPRLGPRWTSVCALVLAEVSGQSAVSGKSGRPRIPRWRGGLPATGQVRRGLCRRRECA
ncbi:hypothetical protein [Amycolatopsis kentuckyensis]|uniref:hypothetical protein n=1 Tax=Amycolatopsis kentuckyensis TaxID=218823 RepID=UPI0035669A22